MVFNLASVNFIVKYVGFFMKKVRNELFVRSIRLGFSETICIYPTSLFERRIPQHFLVKTKPI